VQHMTGTARGNMAHRWRNIRHKAGVTRAILDKGWGALPRRLVAVCAEEGSEIRVVAAAHTSVRCRQCGYTNASNRESQGLFRCKACSWSEHADLQPARNIKHLGTVGWLESSQGAPADGRAAAGRGVCSTAEQLRQHRRSRPWCSTGSGETRTVGVAIGATGNRDGNLGDSTNGGCHEWLVPPSEVIG